MAAETAEAAAMENTGGYFRGAVNPRPGEPLAQPRVESKGSGLPDSE